MLSSSSFLSSSFSSRSLIKLVVGRCRGAATAAAVRLPSNNNNIRTTSPFLSVLVRDSSSSSSVTYSGGQATEGQGGFYGSGGARVLDVSKVQQEQSVEDQRPAMLALTADVQRVTSTMEEVDVLQHSLEKEDSDISPRAIELRQTIKKLLTGHQFMECLNRLEVQGSPVWGLSSEERQLIIQAREMVNEC